MQTFTVFVDVTCFVEGYDQAPGMWMSSRPRFLCLVLLLFFREQRINDNTLMQANNDNPVLNNPYEEPQYYYDTDMNGNIDYATVINGRRPFGYDVNIVPKKRGDQTIFSQEDFISVDPNAEFINGIRKEVKEWRESGYPKASRITKELLDFWFNNK